MKRVRETDFYLDKPKMLGWRGLSLLIPACFSAIGFFAFAVLGFGFTELATLPETFRTALVLVGAFSLAFGGEIGTLSNTVEIFRKNGQATVWDWTALVISVLSTLASFLLAFSALLGATAGWSDWLLLYGPVLIGLLAALDSYGGFVEFGLYLSTYDERMKTWRLAFEQYKRDEYTFAREQAKASTTEETSTNHAQAESTLEQARTAKAVKDSANKETRIAALLDAFSQDSYASVTRLAKELGTSRTTVYNYLDELEGRGAIRKNGKGVEILQPV